MYERYSTLDIYHNVCRKTLELSMRCNICGCLWMHEQAYGKSPLCPVCEKERLDKVVSWMRDAAEVMKDINFMEYDEWYASIEAEFDIEMAESGADREYDYDPEQILEDRYETYRKSHT